MSAPRVLISSEAQSIYHQAINRAARRTFLHWEVSSQSEAEQNITQTFYEAAGLNEIASGILPQRDRVLDASEARLALATLDLYSGGHDELISSGEAEESAEKLRDAFYYLTYLSAMGLYTQPESLSQAIRRDAMNRAQGWRRISDQSVSREIGGMFRLASLQQFDGQPGLSPIESLLVYLYLNEEVGSDTAAIGFTDSLYAFSRLENAL